MARVKADRSEGRIGLILLVGLALSILLTQRGAALQQRSTPLLAADVQAPVAEFLGTPFRAIEASFASAEDRSRALEENRALRAELVELRRDTARLAAMQARLRRLEAMLDVRMTGDIPSETVTARVVSDPGSPFARSLLLSAGQNSGVRDGHAVLSDAGLIGHVVSAGQGSARVLRLDDLNSRVAVMSERSGARAILVGANDGAAYLRFVSNPELWTEDDRVVTSGDDGQMPQGLPVGILTSDSRVALDFATAPMDWVVVLPFVPMADAGDVEIAIQAEDAG